MRPGSHARVWLTPLKSDLTSGGLIGGLHLDIRPECVAEINHWLSVLNADSRAIVTAGWQVACNGSNDTNMEFRGAVICNFAESSLDPLLHNGGKSCQDLIHHHTRHAFKLAPVPSLNV